jgi:internalin A
MVLVLVLGSTLGFYVRRVREQRDIVAAIERSGGFVRYDWELFSCAGPQPEPPFPVWLVDYFGCDCFGTIKGAFVNGPDSTLAHIRRMDGIEELHLGGSTTDDALRYLEGMTSLKMLVLEDESLFTNNGLVHLKGLPNLTFLRLVGLKLTDAGLANMSGLSGLRVLYLPGHPVTDAGLICLPQFEMLEYLDLADTGVTDAGLEHIGRVHGLKELDLTNTKIKGHGLNRLKELGSLEKLVLSGTDVDDAGLKDLSRLPNLRVLELNDTEVTDACLVNLRGLVNLRALRIGATKIRGTGLIELQGLPQLEKLYFPGLVSAEACIAYVKRLPALKQVSLSRSEFSSSQLKRLREALAPTVTVDLR